MGDLDFCQVDLIDKEPTVGDLEDDDDGPCLEELKRIDELRSGIRFCANAERPKVSRKPKDQGRAKAIVNGLRACDVVRQREREEGKDFLTRNLRELSDARRPEIPVNATHRVLFGDFDGEYVLVQDRGHTISGINVLILTGKRQGMTTFIFPIFLAKKDEKFPDAVLVVLSESQKSKISEKATHKIVADSSEGRCVKSVIVGGKTVEVELFSGGKENVARDARDAFDNL